MPTTGDGDGVDGPTTETPSNASVSMVESVPRIEKTGDPVSPSPKPGAGPGDTAELEDDDDGANFVATAERVPLFSWGSTSAPSLPSVDSDDDRYVGVSNTFWAYAARPHMAWHNASGRTLHSGMGRVLTLVKG